VSEPVIIHVVDDDERVRTAVVDLVSSTAFLEQATRDEPGCVIVKGQLSAQAVRSGGAARFGEAEPRGMNPVDLPVPGSR
jgi:hypothetical protein